MAPFLTVKEAAQRTGKSPSSIRRVIYPIIQDEKHPDRSHIQPSVDQALQLRMKGENFAWRLSEELLRREVPVGPGPEAATPLSATKTTHGDGPLLAMLRAELEIKNHQINQQSDLIAKQMELINGLSERLREGNVLMGSLQQRLALPEPRAVTPPSPPTPTKQKRSASPHSEKGSTVSPKPAKAKKGLFSRIFG